MVNNKQIAFEYYRRSQDRADRQVLSIEGQKAEAAKLVNRLNLTTLELSPESRSAFAPGRPVFNEMMDRIEAGEAQLIVTWEAARLARNPVDSGRIIWALETGKLVAIITPTREYRNTTEDKFLLQIEFGVSKMYSDRISSGVKRGNTAKYERGEYPGNAPNAYNNVQIGQHKNIAPDPVKGPLLRQIAEQAATGTYTLDRLHKYALAIGFTSRGGKPISKTSLRDTMVNRLYAGTFFHGGEWRQGTYEPIIPPDLFGKVQVGMGFVKGDPKAIAHTLNHKYKGVLLCGFCGCSITAETKTKTLSDGTVVDYIYYHCTRKNHQKPKCTEPAITEEDLEKQLTEQLNAMVISEKDAKRAIELVREHHRDQADKRKTMVSGWRGERDEAAEKLDALLEMRLNGELTRDEFEHHKLKLQDVVAKNDALLSDRTKAEQNWLELAEDFFSGLVQLKETFEWANPDEKRQMLAYVGSNWTLNDKKVAFEAKKPYDLVLKIEPNKNWRARPDSNRRSSP